jgi:hypothetical protein
MAVFGTTTYSSVGYGRAPITVPVTPVSRNPDGVVAKEWYFREKPGAEIFGPIPFWHAEMASRRLSKDIAESGQAEMLTTVGDRPGDPPQPGGPRFVVAYIFLRGKKTFAGRQAVIQSKKNIV